MTDFIPELRPLTLSEIIDRAVRLYRNNFTKFIGIVALVQVPLSMFQLLIAAYSRNNPLIRPVDETMSFTTMEQWVEVLASSGYLERIVIQVFIAVLSFILLQGVATAALTRAVADNYLGRKTEILEAYQRLGGSWARLIGVLILMVLLYIAVILWLIIPCIGWISAPGILIYLTAVIGPLLASVVVLENRGGGAIRRAWDLVRRRFWWVLGFMIILAIFNQIITVGPSQLLSLILEYAFDSQGSENYALFSVLVESLVGLVTSLVYLPLQLAAITVMYFDLRVRTEGFDLAVLSRDIPAGDLPEFASQTSPSVAYPWITGKEVGYFVSLTILVVGGVFLFSLLLQVFFLALYL